MQKIVVKSEEKPRLDLFIIDKVPEFTRAFVQKLQKQNKIQVNDNKVKSGYKVRPGDVIKIDYDLGNKGKTPKISLPIIFEDTDVLVINKPVGVLSHSKGEFNPEATVETFIKDRINFPGGPRSGIVHRLDRATSGVMICAKNPEVQSWLQKQFSSRKVKKTYIAVIKGHLKEKEAIIDMPIGRNPKAPSTFRVTANGKKSVTSYLVLDENERFSLVELKPTTGRTHQLRVHLAYLGHPIVGDILYGGNEAKRLYLHARDLELTLPSSERKIFSVPLPREFKKFMEDEID